jgi:hypothetical protein
MVLADEVSPAEVGAWEVEKVLATFLEVVLASLGQVCILL